MSKLKFIVVGIICLSSFSLTANDEKLPEAGSSCQGENRNFENCQSDNCTDLISVQCSFIYGNDVITSWGRKPKS
jgi:hypothetical protein